MITSRSMSPLGPGSIALSTTTILFVLQVILALPRSRHTAPTRAVAIISALLEFTTMLLISWILFTALRGSARRVTALVFVWGLGLCIVAAALTAGSLISLSIYRDLHRASSGYLAGTAFMLVASFAAQLFFLTTRLLADRAQEESRSSTPGMQEIGWQATSRVKAVPYDRTTPPVETTSRTVSMDSRTPPPSSGGFSATDTISTIASTFTNAVRPMTSKSHLLSGKNSLRSQRSQRSQRSAKRAPSVESADLRARSVATDDSFDSWDTSNVDPQCRQTVLESTSPVSGSRFLETIPASPTTSRSPSPGMPPEFDLEAPRRISRRSRSFSPAASRTALPAPPKRSFTQQPSASESHIHPLFRSDSPDPAPVASPGTIVIAAPQAGRVISDRQSIRSLSRMRSGSLPAVSSPLTANGSFESFPAASAKTMSAASDETISEAGEEERKGEMPERKITPPIPDYILNAGSSTSLHAYQRRKTESREGPSGPGLEALPPAAPQW